MGQRLHEPLYLFQLREPALLDYMNGSTSSPRGLLVNCVYIWKESKGENEEEKRKRSSSKKIREKKR